MIYFFGFFILASLLLIFPGWLFTKFKYQQKLSILFLGVSAIGVWTLMTSLGIGAQSLANLVELFYVVIFSVLCAYVKMFVLDYYKIKKSTLIIYSIVIVAVIILRLVMPVLPE